VIEDHYDSRQMLSDFLEAADVPRVTENDGRSAMEARQGLWSGCRILRR